MTVGYEVVSRIEGAPALAMPPRPARPLSTWQIIKTRGTNSLALCDDALFDEMFAERRFLWHRIFVVNDPDGVRRVMVDNFENYHRHARMRKPMVPGLRTGLLINDGAIWRRHREMIGPLFHQRAFQPDVPMLVEWTETLARHLAAAPPGTEFNLGDTLSLLLTIQAGHMFAGDNREVDPMIARMATFPGRPRTSDFWPIPKSLRPRGYLIRAEAQQWYPLIDRLLTERSDPAYVGSKDLIWRLVHAQGRDGDRFDHDELRDETLTLALGMIQTTMRPMLWLWYLLAMHPWAEARLRAEFDTVLGGRAPTPQDLPNLVYMHQLIDEAMRLYPPIPIMVRSAVADDVVCGHAVPRGATVIVAPWLIHRHRRLWSDPERFDPERFDPGQVAARSRYSYLPFAVGPRACIAAALARIQIDIAVAVLAQRFHFRLVPGHPIEPTGWTTLRPNRGIRVTVEQR